MFASNIISAEQLSSTIHSQERQIYLEFNFLVYFSRCYKDEIDQSYDMVLSIKSLPTLNPNTPHGWRIANISAITDRQVIRSVIKWIRTQDPNILNKKKFILA